MQQLDETCDLLDGLDENLGALQLHLAKDRRQDVEATAALSYGLERALAELRALDEGATPRTPLEWECRMDVLKQRHQSCIAWSIKKADRLVEAIADEDRARALGEWWANSDWARARHEMASDDLRVVRGQVNAAFSEFSS